MRRFGRGLLVLAALAALAAAVYGGTLAYPFVFDDNHTVVDNPKIRDPANILRFFVMSDMLDARYLQIGFYRPVLFASYALNHLVSGLDPAPWRLTNIALHVAAAFLLFLIMQSLLALRGADPWPWSFLAALVFAAHPVQTETVVYNAARSSLLMSVFALASALLLLRHLATGSRAWLAGSLAAYALALFTKETALPFAGVLALLAFAGGRERGEQPAGRAWLAPALFGALAAGYAILRAVIIANAPQRYVFGAGTGTGDYLAHWAAELAVLPRYLRLVLAPGGLSVDHAAPAPGVGPALVLGLVIAAAWVFLFARALRRDLLLAALVAWPPLALLTEMVIPIEDKLVEYRLYLALAGVAALLVYAGAGRLSRLAGGARAAALLAGALLVVGLGVAARARTAVWESDLALWGAAVRADPGVARPHANLGVALLRAGKPAEAAAQLREALRLRPDFPEAHAGLGDALLEQGDLDAAAASYREALRLRPTLADAAFDLGRVALRRRDWAGAIEAFGAAARLDPRNPLAHHNLAYALTAAGRTDEAIAAYERAIALPSTHADEHRYNLANLHARRGDVAQARRWYAEALRANPAHAEAAAALRRLAEEPR